MLSQLSYRRLILIFVWVVLASVILMLNAYIHPTFNSGTISLFIALLCFVNAASLFTWLLGINKKVSDSETALFKKDVLEVHREELEQIKRQISFQQAVEPEYTKQDVELMTFHESLNQAETSWKYKGKSNLNTFEEYYHLENNLTYIYKCSKVLSMFLSLMTGILILDIQFIPSNFLVFYGVMVAIMIYLVCRSQSIDKQLIQIKKQICPDSLRDLLHY